MTPDFWIDRVQEDPAPLLSREQISAYNRESFASADTMVDLARFPTQINRQRLVDLLRSISNVPDSLRWFHDGSPVTDADYSRYEANLNIDAIAARNVVRFGLVVQRAGMRTYPTDEAVYKQDRHADLDRFQENGLFPADAVAVLHESTDGEWLLVQSYNYLAWVQANAVAIGNRNVVLEYKDREDFVVVTGDKIVTDLHPQHAALSRLQLDMGIRLPVRPIVRPESGSESTGGRPRDKARGAACTIELPVRDHEGRLSFAYASIADSRNVTEGYLPYTRKNLLRQSFKFLGERYGWGHSYDARDCSGFVADVYKAFGIYLPRNSADQCKSAVGRNLRFVEASPRKLKLESLRSLDIGNLIYIPGHVMMYIGDADGEPWVIHDVHRLNCGAAAGPVQRSVYTGVSITPLLTLRATDNRSYLDLITNIKKI